MSTLYGIINHSKYDFRIYNFIVLMSGTIFREQFIKMFYKNVYILIIKINY